MRHKQKIERRKKEKERKKPITPCHSHHGQ
jgi:hypothetical protein